MKEYIVLQMKIDSENMEGNTKNIGTSFILQRVNAESKEEAIGKFIIKTKHITALKKLDVECFECHEIGLIE